MTKFRNIRVRKAGGGYRTQRAMVLASGKLKFVKMKRSRKASGKGSHPVARKRKYRTRRRGRRTYRRSYRRSRRGGMRGGRYNLLHVGIAAAAVGYATSAAGPEFIKANVAKIPGAKTFGNEAAFGVACLAVDRFVKPNKWLRLAGVAGIVSGAMKAGQQGTGFKWLGDGDEFGDLEGDDDMGDDDMGDDDMGDDDM